MYNMLCIIKMMSTLNSVRTEPMVEGLCTLDVTNVEVSTSSRVPVLPVPVLPPEAKTS